MKNFDVALDCIGAVLRVYVFAGEIAAIDDSLSLRIRQLGRGPFKI
jgi:hypothetical protein